MGKERDEMWLWGKERRKGRDGRKGEDRHAVAAQSR